MSFKLKNLTDFEIKENIEGKNETILIIKCGNCIEVNKDLLNNKKCLFCFLENLFINRNQKFNFISIKSYEKNIKFEQFELFLKYFKKFPKFQKISKNIINIRKNRCIFKRFKCKIIPNNTPLFSNKTNYLDPIIFYKKIKNSLALINERNHSDVICQKCLQKAQILLINAIKILDNLKIIQRFQNLSNKNNTPSPQEILNYYKSILFKNKVLNLKTLKKDNLKEYKNEEFIDTYKIGKYGLFQISLYNVLDESEKIYITNLIANSDAEREYIKKIIQQINLKLKTLEFDKIIPIEELIQIYKKESIKRFDMKFKFSEKLKNKIGLLSAIKRLNLEKIYPLLIDDYVEEVFLDSPEDVIYINHQTYGRCRTRINLSLNEIERIKTFLRLYSGQRLDYTNPSIKHVIKNKSFYCRFVIDIPPINLNNFSFDIRKLNKNIFTIQDLLKNSTLNPLMAAFLYFIILRRINITAIGETDTGKTTLINTLDLITPKEFRKIYIENIVESLNQTEFNKHQLKFKVDSIESPIKKYSKSNQIKKLLHRTPDMIFLGEILTKSEAKALFHCLAAGLRGFQTIHADNLDSLLNRFLYHFNINKSCLADLGIIILLKKNFNKRRIISISEISPSYLSDKKLYNTIFQSNPECNDWDLLCSLYETNIIKKIRKYEDLSREKFISFIKIYQEIFEVLRNLNKININELVDFFHKISFYSMNTLKSLNNFWEKWKNNIDV